MNWLYDISLDVPDGKLYFTDSVIESECAVWQANLDGTGLVKLPPGNSQIPYGIARYLPAVPEPSALALLAAGVIALVGYGWRRKARLAKPSASDQQDA